MEDSNGELVSMGSGFLIREKEIATNYHVIAGANAGSVKLIGVSMKCPIEGIAAVDRAHDRAILRVSVVASQTIQPADSAKVQIGDAV